MADIFSDTIFKPLILQINKNTQQVSFPNELLISWSRQKFTLFDFMLIVYLSDSDKFKEILVFTNSDIVYWIVIYMFLISKRNSCV